MISNRELKQNARSQLGGGIFENYWLTILLACLIVSALLSASAFTFVGVFVLTGPLQYGLFRVLTDRVRGREKVEFGDLFKGFEENFSGALVLGLLQSIFIFLWSLLFIVPGIVKSYSYSMSYYLQQEDKSKDWKACLDFAHEILQRTGIGLHRVVQGFVNDEFFTCLRMFGNGNNFIGILLEVAPNFMCFR